MRSVDTNVVVRLLVRDDDVQTRLADEALRHLLETGGVFVSTVVLVEVAYGDRATIAGALRRLIDIDGVVVEREAVIRRALDRYEAGSADFSDYVIVEAGREADALPVLTFDARLAREADAELLTGRG
jgi:predicted nucleic-acid-binding protein